MQLRLSHFKLVTGNLPECLRFYKEIGFEVVENIGKYELQSKSVKIEVLIMGRQIPPHAKSPVAGAMELAFRVDIPVQNLVDKLKEKNIFPLGIVQQKNGSQYVHYRDPDGNLIEFSSAVKK
jgi:catechol 2,3-dioxygenase-like lactoylglutathione lyase family enzyme